MRIALAGLALAVALPARNAPPPAATTPADWIGDWAGKLRWNGCTVDGEPAASIALDAVAGAVAIDLAPAGGALDRGVPFRADRARRRRLVRDAAAT